VPNEYQFDNSNALANTLAEHVSDNLVTAINERGKAGIVVSGGRTPLLFFSALSERPLEWSSVWITLADERWVDTTHSDSNEAMVHKHLLRKSARSARFVGLKNDAATPFDGERQCEATLSVLPHPFDIVLLGMGDDGHTASLFPGSPELTRALDMQSGRFCMSVTPPAAPHLRMSLTLPALLNSRRIVLLFSGANKYDIYRRALMENGSVEALPIRAILHQNQVPVDVYWSK